MKKFLVTGGVGFIGLNLIKKLIENGYNVTSLDNYSTGNKSNEIKGVDYLDMDIEEILNIKENDFDICFHLAAQSRVQPSFDNPQESLRVNVNGTIKVMEWAKKNNIKVIYAGSSSKHHDPSDSPYAMTKFLGEEICKLYKKSFNVNVEIARFYNVYGPYENIDEKYGNVIGIWRAKVKENKPLTIVGDGNQKRDFTHVDDIVRGCFLAWKKGRQSEYMLGTKKQYRVIDIAKMYNRPIKLLPSRRGERFKSSIINNNASKHLNYKAKVDIKDYINNFIK